MITSMMAKHDNIFTGSQNGNSAYIHIKIEQKPGHGVMIWEITF